MELRTRHAGRKKPKRVGDKTLKMAEDLAIGATFRESRKRRGSRVRPKPVER